MFYLLAAGNILCALWNFRSLVQPDNPMWFVNVAVCAANIIAAVDCYIQYSKGRS